MDSQVMQKTVTSRLKEFERDQRVTLEQVRGIILEALPASKEVIKYGIPTYEIEGVAVIGFDGFKYHNSIFPYGSAINEIFAEELAKYEQTKGSIHFDKERAFPKGLLRRIIKERIRIINASYPKKNGEYLQFSSKGELRIREKRTPPRN